MLSPTAPDLACPFGTGKTGAVFFDLSSENALPDQKALFQSRNFANMS